VAAHSRRSPPRAASGSSQIAYHGSSQAVDTSSASIAQPAITRQSAPRRVRHSVTDSTTQKPARYRCRHQDGVPDRPTRRAVSAGTLWVATSCCCSPTAPRKPSAWVPKPISPSTARPASDSTAPTSTARRSRHRVGASTTNGSTTPAAIFTPIPATTAIALSRRPAVSPAVSGAVSVRAAEAVPVRGAVSARAGTAGPRARASPRAASASAAASEAITSVSLCAPPTASSSSTGFSPTNAAAHFAERPHARAA